MSVCNELDVNHQASLSERLFAAVTRTAENVASITATSRRAIVRHRRLRATEAALDSLPESIRDDIGWPDLYERQVAECNSATSTRQ
jgi:hypothetical protein